MDKKQIGFAGSIAIIAGICSFVLNFYVYKDIKPISETIFYSIILTGLYFILSLPLYGSYAKKLKKRDQLLKPKQLRCFKCENIIHAEETKCPKCGWTWK